MDYRLLILMLSAILLASCSLLSNKPVKKDIPTRFKEFPTDHLPLQAPAQIRWNDYQIPFIKAENDHDCAFLLGMVHAHLRLGQMTLLREVVNYRLAQHAGPLAANLEQTLRTMQLTIAVDSIYASLPPETLAWLTDYITGINFYQKQMTDLPVEMRMLSIKTTPWDVKDVLKLGRLIGADVNWFNWFSLLKMQDEPYWKRYWELLTSQGSGIVPSGNPSSGPMEKLLQNGIKSGSNAYAIAPQKTAINSPIMASDPHLGLQLPNMWLIAGYQCPSYHVLGLMFPGIPMVMVGRNEQISWSGTNMRSASSDLYELNPDDISKLKSRRETIKVRGWFDRSFIIRESTLGPVISDAPYLKTRGKTLAMRWVGHQASDEMTALLKVNQASDWNTFTTAFSTYAVSGQNFIYADKAGHIGLLPAVRIPVRHYSTPPDLTLPSSDKALAWDGYLDPTSLPRIYDPASGFIASANNKPFKTDSPLGFFFSADDRIRRLKQMLGNNSSISIVDIRALQSDTYVASAYETARLMDRLLDAAHVDIFTDEENKARVVLQKWDGRYDAREQGPVLYQMMLYYFCKDYFTPIYGKNATRQILASDMVNEYVKTALADPRSKAKTSLSIAFRKATAHLNRYPSWGDMHQLPLNHMLGNIPLLGKRFRFGSEPIGGTSNSLMKTAHHVSDKRTTATYGADARFISFLNDDNENYFVLMGGQDGWVGSPGLTDQVSLWLSGQYIRIPFQWTAIETAFPRLMKLTP